MFVLPNRPVLVDPVPKAGVVLAPKVGVPNAEVPCVFAPNKPGKTISLITALG